MDKFHKCTYKFHKCTWQRSKGERKSIHKCTWEKELGRKKKYYIEEFNPNHNHQQKAYIGANIYWRAKIIIAQLRTNSHQLHCEKGHWKRPKEVWEERVCIFCFSGKVETKNISFQNVKSSKTAGKVMQIFWQLALGIFYSARALSRSWESLL